MGLSGVIFACGHVGSVELSGPQAERDRKLAWYADCGLCPECAAKDREQRRDAETQKAVDENIRMGLRPLSGTDNQVAWAEVIRRRLVLAAMDVAGKIPEQQPVMESCLDELRNHVEAKWWIDRREKNAATLIVECAAFTVEAARSLGIEQQFWESREQIAKVRVEHDKARDIAEKRERVRCGIISLFGEDLPVVIGKFGKAADKRIFVGEWGNRVAEYFHDGNRYEAPKKLVLFKGIERDRADALGISADEFRDRCLAAFAEYCGYFDSLRLR